MYWQKKGLIFVPDGRSWWARGYAHLPTVDIVQDKLIRVYFASLDENKYGRIGYVDLDIDNPHHILYISAEPVLDIGELGCFDDCGTVPSCIINIKNKKYLYYIGFQRAERIPYMLFTGLAIGNKDNPGFKKYARTPILDRTNAEPFSRSAPFVLLENNVMKMWYWSCIEWKNSTSGIHYTNVIKYATSKDGKHWQSYKHNCIEPDFLDEFSIGRPCVIHKGNLYQMWYSIRSHRTSYAIGYAESEDGINWIRKDKEVGIAKAESGWDSEMVCYPYIIDIKGQLYMFYNGNRHGASGFGYAILQS